MIINKKYSAFSLAELLVALSILAIVAVMTVPSLKDEAQRKENAAKVTKAYASLAQAFDYMEAQLPVSLWKADWQDAQLKKQLNIVGEDCFANTHIRFLNGGSDSNYGSSGYLLADGSCVKLIAANKSVLPPRWGMGTGYYYYEIFIDVNGNKRPNVWGQDVFLFTLATDSDGKSRGLIPSGVDGCTQTAEEFSMSEAKMTEEGKTLDKYGCAAQVIKKGKTE